jgi:hypothetical protein
MRIGRTLAGGSRACLGEVAHARRNAAHSGRVAELDVAGLVSSIAHGHGLAGGGRGTLEARGAHGIGGTISGETRALLLEVARAIRRAAHLGRGREGVTGARNAGARARLWNITWACGRAAHGAIRGQAIRGTRERCSAAGLGDIARSLGRAAHEGRRLEVAHGACATVAIAHGILLARFLRLLAHGSTSKEQIGWTPKKKGN